jgi:transcription-repair coupling factor (superfamily II helicase)
VPSTTASDVSLGPVEDDLVGLLGRKRYVRVGGVHGAGIGLLLAGLARRVPAVLVVTGDARLAEAVALDAQTFSGRPTLRLPTWPADPAGTPDADVLASRVQALTALRAARRGEAASAPILVAPVAALVQDVPPPSAVEGAMLRLEEGAEHSLPSLLEHLALSGYVRVAAVESPGEFASRGGVLDLFPFGEASPSRVDFFGDAIESISAFDPATGRLGARTTRLEALCLPPDRLRDPAPAWGPALATEHLPDAGVVVVVVPATVAA